MKMGVVDENGEVDENGVVDENFGDKNVFLDPNFSMNRSEVKKIYCLASFH